MSKRRVKMKTKTLPEKPSAIEPLSDKIIKILSQSIRLFWEEVKNYYRTKSFVAFAALMVLPMLLILILYAVTQYPLLLNRVQISLFLNGIYLENGAILTFRDIFAETMGIGLGTSGVATLYYTGVPMAVIVALISCGIIASERDKGTLPVYVSKPIYKTQLVLAKFFAFAFISLILTAIVFYTMYFVFAFSILSPLGILAEGLRFTIYAANTMVIVTWVFIMTAGSITMLFSSIVDRPIIAGVISLVYLLVVSFFSRILMMLLGSISESLKYLNLSSLANSILNVSILGIDYYREIWQIISLFGFYPSQLLGSFIDPTTAATLLISILMITLGTACIITEIREVK